MMKKITAFVLTVALLFGPVCQTTPVRASIAGDVALLTQQILQFLQDIDIFRNDVKRIKESTKKVEKVIKKLREFKRLVDMAGNTGRLAKEVYRMTKSFAEDLSRLQASDMNIHTLRRLDYLRKRYVRNAKYLLKSVTAIVKIIGNNVTDNESGVNATNYQYAVINRVTEKLKELGAEVGHEKAKILYEDMLDRDAVENARALDLTIV